MAEVDVQASAPDHGPDSEGVPKKQKKKKRARPPPAPTPKLFEQVSQSMVEKLVHDMQLPHASPTLLDRLKALGLIDVRLSGSSTPDSSTTTIKAVPSQGDLQSLFFNQANLHPGSVPAQQKRPNTPFSDRPSTSFRTNPKSKATRLSNIFTLGDFAAVDAISMLTDTYGRVSHMGILDESYKFFVSSGLDAALCFKVRNHVCLVGGDPLCPDELVPALLEEFKKFRAKHSWGLIFIGASDKFKDYALSQKWTTIQFGHEIVLNPATNPVILETKQKRLVSQNRQLLDPSKHETTLGIYNPSILKDAELEAKLVAVYDAWREARNAKGEPQVYITVFDPFAITGLMTYVYTMDRLGTPNGFAALRRIGANDGFHLDPYIAHPLAPRGISDLLVFSCLSLLNAANCTYLSLGYEPLSSPGTINNIPRWLEIFTRKAHTSVCTKLKVSGKKAFNDKWGPDKSQKTGLHIVFPDGTPGVQDIVAIMHFCNVGIRGLAWKTFCDKLRMSRRAQKRKDDTEEKEVGKKYSSEGVGSESSTAVSAAETVSEKVKAKPRVDGKDTDTKVSVKKPDIGNLVAEKGKVERSLTTSNKGDSANQDLRNKTNEALLGVTTLFLSNEYST